MTLLFADYEVPLFIVDDPETRTDIINLYRWMFPRTRVSFTDFDEFTVLQDSEPEMVRYNHDVIIAVDAPLDRLDELNRNVIVWR